MSSHAEHPTRAHGRPAVRPSSPGTRNARSLDRSQRAGSPISVPRSSRSNIRSSAIRCGCGVKVLAAINRYGTSSNHAANDRSRRTSTRPPTRHSYAAWRSRAMCSSRTSAPAGSSSGTWTLRTSCGPTQGSSWSGSPVTARRVLYASSRDSGRSPKLPAGSATSPVSRMALRRGWGSALGTRSPRCMRWSGP